MSDIGAPAAATASAPKPTEATAGAIGTLEVINNIGMKMHLPVASPQDAYTQMRKYGKRGWISTELPPGGYFQPFAMEAVFDWDLIGARVGKMKKMRNGTMQELPGVWYRNEFYERRQPPNNPNKNLGDMIKYSRGGRETDDEQAVEKTTGEFTYVALITFRGNGPMTLRMYGRVVKFQKTNHIAIA